MSSNSPPRALWASRLGFILAAAGSAVGLGNIWKFPYITGNNGGGAFVLVYLVCIAVVGLPIMMAELMIGRHTRRDAVGAFVHLEGRRSPWLSAGWISIAAAFIILSYYSVVAGWTLDYIYRALTGSFTGQPAEAIEGMFGDLVGDGPRQILWHFIFILLCLGIVIGGVQKGIERWSKILMPILFALLALLFVNGLLELGGLSKDERAEIDAQCAGAGRSVPEVLEQATTMLSGLSRCAGLVVAPKLGDPLKHIEFVSLGPGRALVVLISVSGVVENRIIDVPAGLPASSLVEASNYLTARMIGRTLADARTEVQDEIRAHKTELDALTSRVVEDGLAVWANTDGADKGVLIVRGQARLLEDVTAVTDLERIRGLFEALETKEALLRLIDAADIAQGVQIFIGAENELFSMAGCSMVIAPFAHSDERIVGAIGVIGPTRMNYARIIPMVDYTAKIVSGLLSK